MQSLWVMTFSMTHYSSASIPSFPFCPFQCFSNNQSEISRPRSLFSSHRATCCSQDLLGALGLSGERKLLHFVPLCCCLLFVSKHVSSTPSNRPPLIAGRLSGRIQKNKRSPDNHKPVTFKRDLKTLCLDLSRQGGGVGPQSSLEGGVRNVGG